MYDFVIIGGGIAGLYSFYKLQHKYPNSNIVLLERNSKPHLGGRANTDIFYGVPIPIGAGIGRTEKDELLLQLMRELHIPIHKYVGKRYYAENLDCNVEKTFRILRNVYKKLPISEKRQTFRQFATKVLGTQAYKLFITCSGYTDYEHEDVYDTLFYYGFDENYGDLSGFSVPWKLLIEKLAETIGWNHIHCNTTAVHIAREPDMGFSITVQTNKMTKTVMCKQIVLATTVDTVRALLPKATIFKQIQKQPFLRVYGKFSKSSASILQEKIPGFTIVSGPLQKIIPISPEKGVYMIAYSDNNMAVYLKKYLNNNAKNRAVFTKLIENAVGISPGSLELLAMIHYYWDIGTHYYESLHGDYKDRKDFIKHAQHPISGITVVGELVSFNQGWVEGALQSVETGLNL
jgi:hypothetical protein